MAKLTDEQIKVIVDAEIAAAMGQSGEISEERTVAMERYLAEPMGNELEGRSAVQARDVIDVIEWILPSLIRMFTNADTAVEIEPVGPEDESAAEQETDVINHYFWKKHDGFLILYTWFKDALLQKNGILKLWVEEEEKASREEYSNLVDEEFIALNAQDNLDLVEHTTRNVTNDMGGEIKVHDAVFTNSEKKVVTKIENIPPEEFLISTDAKNIFPKNARFCGHYTEKTISELVEMGYSDEEIDMMQDGISHAESEVEAYSRNHLSDEHRQDNVHEANRAMRTKQVTEGYLLADRNGDGIAELLKVFRSGEFIDIEEIDHNPFHALTPIILTHKFYGLSVADIIRDIQENRTAILRTYLDNFTQIINGTTYYNENTVNIEDLLTSKPYGIRAVDGQPGAEVLHVSPGGLPPEAFTLMDLMKDLRADRIGDFQSQLDPNVLANANNGVVVEMLNEAKAKVEMIARIFAETGVKSLFRDLHTLLRKHVDKEEKIKLRNQWVPVNPSSWRERTDFTVKVGLGIRNKQEEAVSMQGIIDNQFRMLETGQLAPVHIDPQTQQPIAFPIWESMKRFSEIMGEKNPERYFPNPMTVPPPPPPPPDPQMDILALTARVEEAKNQTKQIEVQLKNQIEQAKLQLQNKDIDSKQVINELKIQLDGQKAASADMARNAELQIKELESMLKTQQQISDQDVREDKIESDERIAEEDRKMEMFNTRLSAVTDLLTSEALPEEPRASASERLLAALVDQIGELKTQLTAPKEVMRDSEGRITQVGNQRVIRDDDGNLLRLE